MSDGSYGCCPIPEAICCSDQLHCCPKNTKCDTEKGNCVTEANYGVEWRRKEAAGKLKAAPVEARLSPLVCPDGTSCDARNTCCATDSNTYGCCPFANAVCCSNKAFCCPEGTVCGDRPGLCIPQRGVMQVPFVNWHRIEVKAERSDRDLGGQSECGEESRCSKPDGGFGCCPYKNGTCCGTHGYCW